MTVEFWPRLTVTVEFWPRLTVTVEFWPRLTVLFKADTIINTDNPEDFPGYIDIINRHFVQIRELKDTVLQLRYNKDGTIANIMFTDRQDIMRKFAGCGRVLQKIIEPTKEDLEVQPALKPKKIYCDLFGVGGYFWRTERRMARRIVFEPRPSVQVDPDDFNLFQGLPFDKGFRDNETSFRDSISNDQLSDGARAMLKQMKHTLANNDEERFWTLQRWLNRVIVTRTKTDHFFAFIGLQGTGKSMWFGDKGVVQAWYGGVDSGYYVKFNNIDNLTRNFNSTMAQGLFITLEEAGPYRKSNTNPNIMKDQIDAAKLLVEPKGKDQFWADCHFSMNMCTER